jgi:hypothetical protein
MMSPAHTPNRCSDLRHSDWVVLRPIGSDTGAGVHRAGYGLAY